ncbi:hypothetical protein INT43_000468 [Umbelopsis isabellina]|uniref:Glutathione S-transferase n=1 Tax=Mortierella isabellina TaxID=91625 RepID=A0A8H7Q191_MORIS|nr:hypothetical protein INT43_000468 [Umbelopsis isabellina]
MAPTSSFELFYFELHGFGLPARILLSLSGFDWTNRFPTNWAGEEKAKTPFGKIPLLTETRADGSKFVLAESSAICRYIARKANFYSDNEEEAALIDQFASNLTDIVVKGFRARSLKTSDPEQYKVEYEKYRDNEFKPAFDKHEQHLAKSASGYYVGDRLTLADVFAVFAIALINQNNVEISEETYPHMNKLYQKIAALEPVKAELNRFPKK